MKNRIRDIYERWLVKRYLYLGSYWGEMESYSYLGKSIGYDITRKKYKKLEKKLRRRGYCNFPSASAFVLAGRRGSEPKAPKRDKRRL